MTDKPVFLTPEGLKKLEEELDYLETEEAPRKRCTWGHG
jgi:hypothetical protein